MSDYAWIPFIVLLAMASYLLLRRPPAAQPAAAARPKPKQPKSTKAPEPKASAREPKATAAATPREQLDKSVSTSGENPIIKLTYEEDDEEITMLAPRRGSAPDRTVGAHPTPLIIDEDAAGEEPTGPVDLILIHAAAQTDKGLQRKRNEDSCLILADVNVYTVADGMGGYAGGDVASQLAVQTVEKAFATGAFPGQPFEELPHRASELVQAIEAANGAIVEAANKDPSYRGMGTTIVAARFSPRKQRLYIGHVGDSRAYRMRSGVLLQMTVDHTMAAAGSKGPQADRLMRALGVSKSVDVDLLVAKPRAGDIYLLCTDGLSKMLREEQIQSILNADRTPTAAVEAFVQGALAAGGKDNVTVIVIRVDAGSRIQASSDEA